MFWPRLQLTPDEKRYSTKYFDPKTGRGVLRRIYPGFLEINEIQQAPFWNFQIARRCRVFGFTAIGDVHQIRIQFQDASGEQYFVNPMVATSILGGWAASGLQAFPNPNTLAATSGVPVSIAPFIFEPSVVLKPNQVMGIGGTPVLPYAGIPYRMDFCIHVWEFPNYVPEMDQYAP